MSWPLERDPVFGCLLWRGKLGSNGRPVIWAGKKPQSAYKVIYEAEVAPVPEGFVLDHLCRRVLCCNVQLHVEPTTAHENELRKSWPYRCKRKLCPRGHSMEFALVTPEMGRLCRTCHVEAMRAA